MRHPGAIKWEKKLKTMMRKIDSQIEEKYGKLYPLHPARAKKGSTGNAEHDGLFRIGAAFSPGFGSKHGRGYVIDVEMITLSEVPEDIQIKIEDETVILIKNALPIAFPDTNLQVEKDGHIYKIFGDLSLGKLQ